MISNSSINSNIIFLAFLWNNFCRSCDQSEKGNESNTIRDIPGKESSKVNNENSITQKETFQKANIRVIEYKDPCSSLSHTHAHSLSIYFSLSHTHTCIKHTHTHYCTLYLSLSLSLIHTHIHAEVVTFEAV